MVSVSVRYRFSQSFVVPPADAFEWITDYDPGDMTLMGLDGRRKITRLTDDTLVLTDTLIRDGKPFSKDKLVRIYPEKLMYTSTHISGPNLHSQFLYEVLPEGKLSRLEFTGAMLYQAKRMPSAAAVEAVRRQERDGDAGVWKQLAQAMARDLKK